MKYKKTKQFISDKFKSRFNKPKNKLFLNKVFNKKTKFIDKTKNDVDSESS